MYLIARRLPALFRRAPVSPLTSMGQVSASNDFDGVDTSLYCTTPPLFTADHVRHDAPKRLVPCSHRKFDRASNEWSLADARVCRACLTFEQSLTQTEVRGSRGLQVAGTTCEGRPPIHASRIQRLRLSRLLSDYKSVAVSTHP